MKLTRSISLIALALSLTACGASSQSNANSAPTGTPTKLKFDEATAASGVKFQHVPSRTENKWLPEIMGSGVAVADFNRDGAPDIFLTNSGALKAAERPAGAGDRLYLNNGKGVFTDRTDEWGVVSSGYGQGVAVGDFDNDGWTDVFLTTFEGKNRLLKNTGTKFEDVTRTSGITSDGRWATSAGFFDMDADGDLDLYVVRYVDFTTENPLKIYRNRMQVYSTPIYYNAVADQLWRNDGNGRFTDVSVPSGIAAAKANGLALALGDIDSDGDTDVYVANDSDANLLWINDGKGQFKDIAKLAGTAYSQTGVEEGSMGADFSDIDNDSRPDIAVTNFQDESTAVYVQSQPLLFREVSDAIGIGQSARARLKFGIDFFDADNDGDEDLIVANGHIEDNIDRNSESVTFAQPNTLYENLGNGRFADVSAASGDALADVQVSRGLATGDLNSDGGLDFVISNNGGTAQIALNSSGSRGNFVVLWLEGAIANRSAIGARLVARIGDRTIERQVMGAQSYLSVSDLRLHFGLGPASQIDELTIHWPGGEKQTLTGIAVNGFYRIVQGGGALKFLPGEKQIPPQ
jgi:enediyne biosynthesis protein E4